MTDEQKRLYDFLWSWEGKARPKTAVDGYFSKATTRSLLKNNIIIDDYATGYYKLPANK